MTAVGSGHRFHAGARVRVTTGAHAGRTGTLLAPADTPADIARIELDAPSAPHDRYVRIRRYALETIDTP